MSTTINSYSIALGLNADGLIDGSRLARNEARALDRTFKQLATPMEKVQRQLDLLEKAVDEGAIRESVYREGVRRLTGSLQDNTTAINANAEAIRRDNALIAEGERLTKSLMTTEERHAQEIRRINELRKQGTIGATTYNRAIAQANTKLADSRIVTAQVVKEPPTLRNALRPGTQGQGMVAGATSALSNRLTNLAAGYIGVYAAANFASEAIRKSAGIEKAAASYEVLTGSAEKAKDIMTGVRDIASRGVSMTALNQSAQTMLSSNVAAQDIIPTLRQMSEITGGNTDKLQRMSLAFSQVSGNGRLMAEELNQMVEAGFNPLQEIWRTTGRSMVDLRKDMADGLITFDMVKGAFQSVTEEGGHFHGMFDRIGETTAGALNKASASFEAFQIAAGDAMGPAVQAIVQDFSEAVSSGGELIGIIRDMAAAIVELNDSMKSLTGKGVLGTMTSGFGLASAVGSQVSATIGDTIGVGRELLSGDFSGAAGKLGDVFTPFEKINDFLDQQQAQQLKAQQAAARAAMGPQAPATPATAAEAQALDPAKVAQTYDRLQASIKAAQASAIPTLNNLQKQVAERERLTELMKEQDRLENEASRIREQAIDPAEKLARSVADIERMQQLGMLTPAQADRAQKELFKDAGKDINIEQPGAMTVGSQEAYKLITGIQNDRIERQIKLAEEQKALAQAQVDAAKLTNQKLDKLAEVSPRKIR